MGMEQWWNDTDRGNQKNSEKICPSDTLSITNPTWTDLGANPGLRGEKSLSYLSNLHVSGFAVKSLLSYGCKPFQIEYIPYDTVQH
jgi:hypothetical protein